MAADSTVVQQRVTEALNACSPAGFSTTIGTGYLDRNATALLEAVREGAMMIARAILANPNHVHRGLFVSSSPTALTHGGEMPDMAGECDVIEIQPYVAATYITGTPATVQQIDDWRTNLNTAYGSIAHNAQGSPISGRYAIAQGRIKFTGNAAQVYLPVLTRTGVTSLIPDEYEDVWFMLAMGLTPKEGDNVFPIAQYFYNCGIQQLPSITSMGTITPAPSLQRAMQARGDS